LEGLLHFEEFFFSFLGYDSTKRRVFFQWMEKVVMRLYFVVIKDHFVVIVALFVVIHINYVVIIVIHSDSVVIIALFAVIHSDSAVIMGQNVVITYKAIDEHTKKLSRKPVEY
jgi:hypothetical protein